MQWRTAMPQKVAHTAAHSLLSCTLLLSICAQWWCSAALLSFGSSAPSFTQPLTNQLSHNNFEAGGRMKAIFGTEAISLVCTAWMPKICNLFFELHHHIVPQKNKFYLASHQTGNFWRIGRLSCMYCMDGKNLQPFFQLHYHIVPQKNKFY